MELFIDNFRLSGAITAAAVVSLTLAYQWLSPKPLPNFPHNPVNSILGDIPELTRMIKDEGIGTLDYLTLLIQRHGPVAQFLIGRSTLLLIADKKEAERIILREKNVDQSLSVNMAFGSIMPTGQISLPTNAMWKRHRRIAGPSMHRRFLSRMTTHVSVAASELVKLWQSKIEIAQGESFMADADIKLATMDAITTILTSSSSGNLSSALASISKGYSGDPGVANISGSKINPICQAIESLLANVNLGVKMPLGSITFPIYLWFSPTWRRHHRVLRTYLRDAIQAARKREDLWSQTGGLMADAECIVDIFVQQGKRGSNEVFGEDEMLDEMTVLIAAGQDTGSAALSWFVKYMATDPDIQQRLHAEVCNALGPNLDAMDLETLDNVEKMPILEAVTTETLRCGAVGLGSRRRLLCDQIIMGHRVPKGSDIFVVTALFGLQESEWGPDAKTWRPDRWLRSDGSFNRDAGPNGDPFGMGHRSCFGQRLALMELKAFIATLSHAFVFKPVPAAVNSWKVPMTMMNRPKQCYVCLERWEEPE